MQSLLLTMATIPTTPLAHTSSPPLSHPSSITTMTPRKATHSTWPESLQHNSPRPPCTHNKCRRGRWRGLHGSNDKAFIDMLPWLKTLTRVQWIVSAYYFCSPPQACYAMVKLPQNTMAAEDFLLLSEFVYDVVVQMVDWHDTSTLANRLQFSWIVHLTDSDSLANHLAIYILHQWRHSIPKGVLWPPDGYLEPITSMHVNILYEVCPPLWLWYLLMVQWWFRFLNTCTSSIYTTSARLIGLFKHCPAIQIRALHGTLPLKTIQPFRNICDTGFSNKNVLVGVGWDVVWRLVCQASPLLLSFWWS